VVEKRPPFWVPFSHKIWEKKWKVCDFFTEINEKNLRKKLKFLDFFINFSYHINLSKGGLNLSQKCWLTSQKKIRISYSKCVVVTNLSVGMKTFGKYQKVRNDRKDVVRLYNNCTSLQFLEWYDPFVGLRTFEILFETHPVHKSCCCSTSFAFRRDI